MLDQSIAKSEVYGQTFTIPDLGSAQGLSLHEGKIYMYGDLVDAKPRVGVIREYDMEFRPAGRAIMLSAHGRPVITHPTGLTWHPKFGCFLGDTVNQKSKIYCIDWDKALADGNLDRAIKNTIVDDAATNGGRPEFVTVYGRLMLATADYGDVKPMLRLYDVEAMLETEKTNAPGVIVHQFPIPSFTQNLHWDSIRGKLTLIQNITPGLGWRLEVIDLAKAVEAGRCDAFGVRIERFEFIYTNELEGYRPLPDGRSAFLSSSGESNLRIGRVVPNQ